MKSTLSYLSLLRKFISILFLAGLLLFFSLGSASAQTLHWSPDSMFFQDVVNGTTASQTLTLTAADAPVSIGSIEWTYMMFYDPMGLKLPAFSYDPDRPVPATLLPGQSMDIEISFSPIDDGVMSFVSANLLITNSALNEAELNYWIEGIGTNDNPCAPLANCDGVCTDLANDPNNCGLCGNVCVESGNATGVCVAGICGFACNGVTVDLNTDVNNCGLCDNICVAPDNATAVCEAGTCDFVCNEGYEPIGNTCQLIVSQTAEELLSELRAFFDAAAFPDEGEPTIVGLLPYQAGTNQVYRFRNRLKLAAEFLTPDDGTDPNLRRACDQLDMAQLRSDGGWPFVMPPDWIAGEDTSNIHSALLAIMELIEGCEPMEAPERPQN